MNYKHSLAALVVAGVFSGQANATLDGAQITALANTAPDFTWADRATWGGLANPAPTYGTLNWSDATASAPCDWKGIACTGTDITHVDIPNAGFDTPLAGVLAALAPDAATITVLNLSTGTDGTTAPVAAEESDLTGPATGLDGFVALEWLALNNIGMEGDIPDMSASSALNKVNVSDNPGITGMGAKLAGGAAISLIGTNNNVAMTGDMTATLAAISTPVNLTVNDTKLYGAVNFTAGDVMSVANSDIIVNNDDGSTGYTAASVVQPADGVTVTGGEASATATWLQTTAGVETGYSVSYSADNGATLMGTTPVTGLTHSFSGMAAGTYKAVVQSTGPTSRMSAPVMSADFVVTAPVVITPPTCEDGEELNAAGTECVAVTEEPKKSSGGGGAALYLALLPLMGLLRRKRA